MPRYYKTGCPSPQKSDPWSLREVNDDVPDQILGFDSWSLYATTNDAGASDVDSPDVKKKPWQVSYGGKKTAGIRVNTKAEGPEASIRFYS